MHILFLIEWDIYKKKKLGFCNILLWVKLRNYLHSRVYKRVDMFIIYFKILLTPCTVIPPQRKKTNRKPNKQTNKQTKTTTSPPGI